MDFIDLKTRQRIVAAVREFAQGAQGTQGTPGRAAGG
jgi:hypothetical protein